MEFRKLISFGKNSFVVSLPKAWIRQNKLVKGDLIYVEESGTNLILSQKEMNREPEEKEKRILIDKRSLYWITREVSSAYILNYRTIVLKGAEVKNRIKELQSVIQNLIALEIMEQSSDSIVARDFLNMDKVSMNELLRKMDVVTRTMMREMAQTFIEDSYETINERDKDVNRLYFLLYRAVLYNMDYPMKAMKNLKLGPIDLLKIHTFGNHLEVIADEVKRTARFTRLIKTSKKLEKEIENIFEKIINYYGQTMKAVHSNNIDLALELSEEKTRLEKDLEEIEKHVQKIEHLNRVVNCLGRMLIGIHNVGRVIYTLV